MERDKDPEAVADLIGKSGGPLFLADDHGRVLLRLEPAVVEAVLPVMAAECAIAAGETDDVETGGGWVRRVRASLPGGPSVISVPIDDLVEKSNALLKDKETLEYQATHDALTDLPNRRAMEEHLTWLAGAEDVLDVAVLHVDLDKFKAVNDTFGHDAGDVVIRDAGDRLKRILRDTDMVARVGGDEFVAICHRVVSVEQVEGIAGRIVQSMKEPIPYGEDMCQIGASVGIALCHTPSDIRQSLNDADVALYEAKRCGRGCYRIYKPQLRQKQTALQLRVNAVREALDMNAFDPFFQPQVCAKTGALLGVEALARWVERERGVLPPSEFMDALEEAKLTEDLDAMILRKSLKALVAWDEMGLHVPMVCVNVSGARLAAPDAVATFKWAVEEAGLDPSRLGIEILEDVFIDNPSGAIALNVRRLSEAGFQMALDDFGTGHASIAGSEEPRARPGEDRSVICDWRP